LSIIINNKSLSDPPFLIINTYKYLTRRCRHLNPRSHCQQHPTNSNINYEDSGCASITDLTFVTDARPSPTPTPAPSLASLTLERKCEWYDVDGTFSDDLDVSPESDPEPEVDLKRDPESEHEPERTPGYQRPERKDSQPKPSSKAVRKSSVSFTHNADNITIELPPALARLITDGFRLSSSTPRYLKAVVNGVVHRPSGRVGVGVWWSDEGRAAGKNVSERIHEGSGSDGEADSHEEGSAGSVSEGVANIIVRAFLPSFLPSFRPSFLPSFLPSFIPSFRPSFLPTD
jgi:hypothetical protein